jgi:5'-deoxynucleotidase YfbR-like HD superfamily hydrolase
MNEHILELQEELETFPGRTGELKRVKRWKARTPMFYRPDLYTHSKHVAWLTAGAFESVSGHLPASFDVKRALAVALVHDDAEIVTDDYEAGDKANMTKEQLAAIDAQEREAIRELAGRFPKTVGGYSYEELLFDILDLTTEEAQFAKYLDRFDGFGEGIHEIYAGNRLFTDTVVTQYGPMPHFFDLNVQLRTRMMQKHPSLAKLQDRSVFFSFPSFPDWQAIVRRGTPHEKTRLTANTEYAQYDLWRKTILDAGDQEEIQRLYVKSE